MNKQILNYLKTFLLCLGIFANCSGIKLVDGLVNDLHIKVKVRHEYIKPTIETIGYERKESPILNRIQSLRDEFALESAIKKLSRTSSDRTDYSEGTPQNLSRKSSIQTDDEVFSDWDEEFLNIDPEEIEESNLQIELKTFDLKTIDSDFFIIEIWNSTKKELSKICYKSLLKENIKYYTVIITPIFSSEESEEETSTKLVGYSCHLEGKENPMDNIVLHRVELKSQRRRFSSVRKN